MSDKAYILAPETVEVQFKLEPVLVNLDILGDLANLETTSGMHPRLQEINDSLTPERRQINKLVFSGLYDAHFNILKDAARRGMLFADFPSFVDAVAAADAVLLRDKALEPMCGEEKEEFGPLTPEEALNEDIYLARVEQYYLKWKAEKGYRFDREFYAEVHRYLRSPQALKQLIVEHLRFMWETVLAAEWRRVRPMLEESIEAFQQLDFSGSTALEAVRSVTGRDLGAVWPEWPSLIVFIPQPYIGPYVGRYEIKELDLVWIMYGARLPEGTKIKSPALSRSELVVRLNALADDTRLRIIELLTQHEELCAQDIITLLDLSQSAASRHLRQLTATGYLVERRREVSKCYSLNRERFDDTLRAVRRFVRIHKTVGAF